MKFKVGDRVKIKESFGPIEHYDTGKIGKVSDVFESGRYPYEVTFECGGKNHSQKEELELLGAKPMKKKFARWIKEKGL